MKADANEVLRHLQNPSDRRRETRTALLEMLKDGPVLGEGRPEQLDLKEAALGRLRDKLHIVSVKDPADAMHGAYCASALVVLAHHRRRVVHFNVTEHPTPAWTAQQLVDAFPDDSAPAYLLRGRDRVDGQPFRHRVKGMGSRNCSPRRKARGRTRLWSGSSARSGASA